MSQKFILKKCGLTSHDNTTVFVCFVVCVFVFSMNDSKILIYRADKLLFLLFFYTGEWYQRFLCGTPCGIYEGIGD